MSDPAMQMTDLIRPEGVVADLLVGDKGELLRELARRASVATACEERAVLASLEARERLGSTGLGRGFALPHARMPALAGFFALFVRLGRAIDYQAVDGAPVDLVFLLLGPDDAGREHLGALAAIARPLRDAAFAQELRRAKTAGVLFDLLRRGPRAPA